MCILFWAIDKHPDYRFVFCGNRDEFLNRPTSPAQFWSHPHDNVLAGQDLELDIGGTWLGITRNGRFSAVTNYREKAFKSPISRGCLVRDYLIGKASVDEYIQQVSDQASHYAGFNLICMDLNQGNMNYYSNREDSGILRLSRGEVYGLSNSVLARPWEKVSRGQQEFEAIIEHDKDKKDPEALTDALFSLLCQTKPFSESNDSVESYLRECQDRIFIPKFHRADYGQGADYATRTSTVVLVGHDGQVLFAERDHYVSPQTETSPPIQNPRTFRFSLDSTSIA